jgi:hypothetical protein
LAKNYFPQNTKKGIFCASIVPITVYNWGIQNNKPLTGDNAMANKNAKNWMEAWYGTETVGAQVLSSYEAGDVTTVVAGETNEKENPQ